MFVMVMSLLWLVLSLNDCSSVCLSVFVMVRVFCVVSMYPMLWWIYVIRPPP